jgi:hypothetical protein
MMELEKNDIEEVEESLFEWNGKVITCILLALVLIAGVLAFFSFRDGIQVTKQQNIAEYIDEVNTLLTQSESYTKQVTEALENQTRARVTLEKEQDLRKLVSAAAHIKAPAEWKGHKEAAVRLISERHLVYYQQLHGLRAVNGQETEVLERLEALEEQEKKALIAGFEGSNIPYKETEEGKITFSVKSY